MFELIDIKTLRNQSSFEPGYEKMCLMSYANNKGADQPAHTRSLISPLVVHYLDSIISLDSIAKISRHYLASVAAQAGLCLAWSETPEDMFCRVVAHLFCSKFIYFISKFTLYKKHSKCYPDLQIAGKVNNWQTRQTENYIK